MICKTSHPVLQRMEMQTDAVVPPPGCVCIKSCRVETSRGGEDPVTQFEPRRKAIGLQIDIRLWSSADQCSLAAERGIECYLQIVLKNQFLIMCCAVMKRVANPKILAVESGLKFSNTRRSFALQIG